MAGENLTLTYSTDALNTTRARCVEFAYGWKVVATESHAREHRAMYPHQRALGTLKIVCKFLNYGEYQTFMQFFRDYAKSWLHPPTAKPYFTPGITATLQGATTGFQDNYQETYTGVPISGITDGDHVGNIGYSSPIIFQLIKDPLDPTMFTGNDFQGNDVISQFALGENYAGGAQDDTTKFFYPASPGSEDITQKATDIYGIGNSTPPPPNYGPAAPQPGTVGGVYSPGGLVTGLPGS